MYQIYKTPDSWKTNELSKEKKEKKADRARKLREDEEARKKKVRDKKEAKLSKKREQNEENAEQRAKEYAAQKAREATYEAQRQAEIQEQTRLRSAREEQERQSDVAAKAAADSKFKKIRAEKGIHCRSFALEGWCQAGRRCAFSHGAEGAGGPPVLGTEEKEEVCKVSLSSLPPGCSWLTEIEALTNTHRAYVAKELASGGVDVRIENLSLVGEVPAGMALDSGIHVSLKLPQSDKYPGQEAITCTVLNESIPANIKSQLRKAAYGCAKALLSEATPLTMLVSWLEKNSSKLLVDRDAMEAMRIRQQEIADSRAGMEASDTDKEEDNSDSDSDSDSSDGGCDPIDMAAFMDQDSDSEEEDVPCMARAAAGFKIQINKGKACSDGPRYDESVFDMRYREEEEAEDVNPAGGEPVATQVGHASFRKGTEIILNGCRLDGIGTVSCRELCLDVSCHRCGNLVTGVVSEDRPWVSECSKCGDSHSLTMWGELLHESHHRVAVVKPEGCAVVDMLPSDFGLTCFGCSAEAPVRGYMMGTYKRIACHSCHKAMVWGFESASYNKTKAPDDEKKRAKMKAAAQARRAAQGGRRKGAPIDNTGITPGKPLPENGACKHYRKSYKWFRFSCCGRAFACDACHDSKTDDGHEALWAKRMICGFCCKEQPFGDNPCVECGKKLAGGSGGGHWNAGKGTRDRTKLSDKDKKKIKGAFDANRKTTSSGAKAKADAKLGKKKKKEKAADAKK